MSAMFSEKLIASSYVMNTKRRGNIQRYRLVCIVVHREGDGMKTGIHPVRASAVETCSHCHPAYTGKAAKVTGGSRIERFERRLARSAG